MPQPDLEMIGLALEDHSPDASWYLDPGTGQVLRVADFGDVDDDVPEDPEATGWRCIAPMDSSFGYRDMEDFIDGLSDPAARETLARTIQGRGAFRRFKDVLFGTFPEHGRAWHAFKDQRLRERAIEWLEDEGLIAPGDIPVRDETERPDEPVERDLRDAYDQLVLALGRAKAAAGVLAEADPATWDPVARLLDESARTAAGAEPKA